MITPPPIARAAMPRGKPAGAHPRPRITHPAPILIALASTVGFLAWAFLALLYGRTLAPPGIATIIRALDSWSVPTSVTSRSTSLPSIARRARPQTITPLQCNSAGLSSVGHALTIGPNEVVCGDVLVVGAGVDVQGEIRGSLQVIGGNTIISGLVTGNVSSVGGDIAVQAHGQVYGATHALGGSVTIAPDAVVNNMGTDLQEPQDIGQPPGLNFSIDIGSFWLSLLFWISATLGVTLFAPEMVGHVRYTISRHFLLSGTIGAVIALVGGLIAIALVFTCLGIPLAILIAIAAWVGWVVGTVGIGAWLGSTVFGHPWRSRQPSLMLSALLGVTILCILKALPVAGAIIGFVAGAVALGAALLTLLSARRASVARRGL